MYSMLVYILMGISFFIILFIIMQPSKQQNVLSMLSTDKSSTLFKTQKSGGISYLLMYITAILGLIWISLGIILMVLGNR